MSLLQNVSLSVTGKINNVADDLVRIVLISDAQIRKRFENPNTLIQDYVSLDRFYVDEEKEITPQMNDSFVYEEGTYGESPAKLYELITKIGTVKQVDDDLVVLEIDAEIPSKVLSKIYQGVPEEDRRKNIKTLHAGSIRGKVTKGQEVLFTVYKITPEIGESKEGISYVILTDRERHFKKKEYT
ncbi:hypothetical protein KY333_03035 [Candidatus Woesearchaeota archaeon]|nr:hypothetical protein [Candidatus Woesearchaeota archaeon]MBW2994166.1 hypothetical protein [Candidatus Woesearchaeota archaeon]